jgi:hypothetical protein
VGRYTSPVLTLDSRVHASSGPVLLCLIKCTRPFSSSQLNRLTNLSLVCSVVGAGDAIVILKPSESIVHRTSPLQLYPITLNLTSLLQPLIIGKFIGKARFSPSPIQMFFAFGPTVCAALGLVPLSLLFSS